MKREYIIALFITAIIALLALGNYNLSQKIIELEQSTCSYNTKAWVPSMAKKDKKIECDMNVTKIVENIEKVVKNTEPNATVFVADDVDEREVMVLLGNDKIGSVKYLIGKLMSNDNYTDTSLTIREVLKTKVFSGKYKLGKNLLKGVCAKNDISLSTKYTEKTQDIIINIILEDLGIKNVKNKSSAKAFANKLAIVWSEFPLKNNRSRYEPHKVTKVTYEYVVNLLIS